MAVIQQHRPSFFTGFTNEKRQYTSLEDLLTIDFVNQFTKSPGFFRFSVSRLDPTKQIILMAEYKEGYENADEVKIMHCFLNALGYKREAEMYHYFKCALFRGARFIDFTDTADWKRYHINAVNHLELKAEVINEN